MDQTEKKKGWWMNRNIAGMGLASLFIQFQKILGSNRNF
jgi:hypothetical protein